MIDRIFIPTVHRVDNQITFSHLPDELKSKVTMVVQAWERDQYHYDCDYLVLPDTSEYHFSDYYCLPRTRKVIYEAGQDMKYAVLDDDLRFKRRNAKYWSGVSDMNISKRFATDDEILEMFALYDRWLDDPSVTVCGCGHDENPPSGKEFTTNSSLGCGIWVNGRDFKHILSDLPLTEVRVAEDIMFLLALLTRGFGNRVSQKWLFHNASVHTSKMASTVWDQQSYEATLRDHKIIEALFPDFFRILYDENGDRLKGGFRNYGKNKISWSKAGKAGAAFAKQGLLLL